MKVVIAGSASLQKDIKRWVKYWNGKKGHTVINYPEALPKKDFDANYPGVHKKFFQDITETNILFIANEKKKGIDGYIGSETFAEMAFGVAQNLLYGKNIKVLLARMPAKNVGCFEEIKLWLRLGWCVLVTHMAG